MNCLQKLSTGWGETCGLNLFHKKTNTINAFIPVFVACGYEHVLLLKTVDN